MFYRPLIDAEKQRLDSEGWRVWSTEEIEIMKRNCAFYDKIRGILSRRCKLPDCGFVVSSRAGDPIFSLPDFADVCEVCFTMHTALQHPGLKSIFYFRNLHQEWKREQNDPKRRDRLGL